MSKPVRKKLKKPAAKKKRYPRKTSIHWLEDEMERQIKAASLPKPVRELMFHRKGILFEEQRRWRFDFAWPGQMVALEVEGGVFMRWGRSRHLTGKGYTADCEKYSVAAILGWKVIRVTSPQVKDGTAIFLLTEALHGTTPALG